MCLGLLNAESFHKPAVLLQGDLRRFCSAARPLEAAGLQTFIQQDETVAFPVQPLDSIAAAAAEQKQCVRERIQCKLLLYDGCQSVDASAQIRIAAGNIDPVCSGKVT